MPLPKRSQLSLGGAARFVASKCSVSIEDARTSLQHAFYDDDLRPVGYDRSGIAVIDWRAVQINGRIDWETSAVEWPYMASSGRHRAEGITLGRYLVEAWLRSALDGPDPQTGAEIVVEQGETPTVGHGDILDTEGKPAEQRPRMPPEQKGHRTQTIAVQSFGMEPRRGTSIATTSYTWTSG